MINASILKTIDPSVKEHQKPLTFVFLPPYRSSDSLAC